MITNFGATALGAKKAVPDYWPNVVVFRGQVNAAWALILFAGERFR